MKDIDIEENNSCRYEIRYNRIYDYITTHTTLKNTILFIYKVLPYFVALSYILVISKLILTPLTSFIVVSFFRKCIDAKRPYVKYNITPLVKKEKKGESMPSRHVFSITIIAMCWLYIYQPIGIVLLILTIILAAVRVIAGVHFIRDVIAGIAVGILCGFIGLWIL